VARLPFEAFQSLDLPLSEVVSGRIGFIHDLFLSFPYEIRDELPSGDRDLVVLTGKGDRREKVLELADYPGRVVLVLAPGDASFRHGYLPDERGLPPNFEAAFVTNNLLPDRRAVNIPLGVRINKLRPLQFVRQNHRGGRKRLLYGNFTVNEEHYRPDKEGRPHLRAQLVERLQDTDWTTLTISPEQRDEAASLLRYYSEIADHRFVLSPEGNGIDCYRTWEALYLGAVPIVKTSAAMSTFADLPILFTEDYSEITEEYLEHRWEEMGRRSFDLSYLLKSRYFHRFLESVAKLRSPRFVCWRFGGTPDEKFIRVLERSSRSAADIFVETPRPPFIARAALTDPGGWRVRGDLEVGRRNGMLRLQAGSDERSYAELPLRTIAGADWKLTGRAETQPGSRGTLRVHSPRESEPLASVSLAAGEEAKLDLRFTTAGDQTLLSYAPSDSDPGSCCFLAELLLEPLV
jgi:hypothetical protein